MLCKVFFTPVYRPSKPFCTTTKLLFIKHHFHQSPKSPKEQGPVVIQVPEKSNPILHIWSFLSLYQTITHMYWKQTRVFQIVNSCVSCSMSLKCQVLTPLPIVIQGIFVEQIPEHAHTFKESLLNTYYVLSLPIKVHTPFTLLFHIISQSWLQ